MSRIRIAAQLHPQHGSFTRFRQAAVEADEMGYDLVYTWDHFFPLYGSPDGAHFECWSLLASIAEATSRAELGPLVTAIPYRNPDLLADMARTVDHIADGRLVLGLGAGWARRDFDEYGYDFGSRASRAGALEEALERIRRRWASLNPPPLHDVPILIGGVGQKRTLRMVARYADGWHAMFPGHPEELVPKVEALRDWCDEYRRNPDDIEWGVGVEPDDLYRLLEQDADVYRQMGFSQFTLGFTGPAWRVAAGSEWLAWRDEVNRSR